MTDALADSDDPGKDARVCTPSDVAAQYRQHHDWLRKVANRFFDGKRPDLADEAIGLLFAHLLELVEEQKLTDLGEGWRGYLRRAVLNRCVDLVRTEKKTRERFPPGDPEAPRIIDRDPLGDYAAAEDLAHRRQEKLNTAVESLTGRQVTIVRHVLKGETNKQIGEELGISGQAVGAQLKTIIKKCHEEVTEDE
ncbi:sigma-70 family RNA polymerase sigma factor [Nocardioides sp. Leaf374]|uniref:sigma-70 family RNA polymerase sigma factor n=1 Tax=Nocardioides sp. Leaf374 TaxID=2876560 RepID=UPI001E37CA74|nr:sigma-70 family RNA polymerase sigma factor [Nocardioides sp. Leaf374]